MNKHTIGRLFKRAYETRLGELRTERYKPVKEISATKRLRWLNARINAMTLERTKLIDAYVGPRQMKTDTEIERFKKDYQSLNARLGFAITNDEKKAITADIVKFLKSIPNCEEAKQLLSK